MSFIKLKYEKIYNLRSLLFNKDYFLYGYLLKLFSKTFFVKKKSSLHKQVFFQEHPAIFNNSTNVINIVFVPLPLGGCLYHLDLYFPNPGPPYLPNIHLYTSSKIACLLWTSFIRKSNLYLRRFQRPPWYP